MKVGKSTRDGAPVTRPRVTKSWTREDFMATGYSKLFVPLNAVKEKEFLSRSMGCKGVG
jgi:hypothetical protein